MHRSEAEGRFGEAEPEGRASVCAEPPLRAFGVREKEEQDVWEWRVVNYTDAPQRNGLRPTSDARDTNRP